MQKLPAITKLFVIGLSLLATAINAQSYWSANNRIVVAGEPIRVVEVRPHTDVRRDAIYTDTSLQWSMDLPHIDNVRLNWEVVRTVYEATDWDFTVLTVNWLVSPPNFDLSSDYAGRTILRWDDGSALHFSSSGAEDISILPERSFVRRSGSTLIFSFDTDEFVNLFSGVTAQDDGLRFVFGEHEAQSGVISQEVIRAAATFLLRSEDELFIPVSVLSSDAYSSGSQGFVPLVAYNDDLGKMVSEFSTVHRHHGEQWPLTWKFMVPHDGADPVVHIERSFIGASGHISSFSLIIDDETYRLTEIEAVGDYRSDGYVDMVTLSPELINRLRSGAADIAYEIVGRFSTSSLESSFSSSEVEAISQLLSEIGD